VLEAALWGLVGGLALVLGALITFVRKPSTLLVAYVLAFGAGVLFSAVAYDLTAEAFELGGGDATAIGLAAGALTYAGLSKLIKPGDDADPESAADGLALGALLDGIPESAAIGLTLTGPGGVSGAFVAAVFLSNLPESFSATSKFSDARRSKRWILGVWVAIALTAAVAAAVGFQVLGGGSENLQAGTKAFAGGAILTMLATEMVPDAYRDGRGSLTIGLVTVLGFALAAGLTAID
jgi:zinc transporter, ZIP family